MILPTWKYVNSEPVYIPQWGTYVENETNDEWVYAQPQRQYSLPPHNMEKWGHHQLQMTRSSNDKIFYSTISDCGQRRSWRQDLRMICGCQEGHHSIVTLLIQARNGAKLQRKWGNTIKQLNEFRLPNQHQSKTRTAVSSLKRPPVQKRCAVMLCAVIMPP